MNTDNTELVVKGNGVLADVRRSADMIAEQFEYKGFTFQRMTKDAKWYVCYANQIVNWGMYQNDLKEWVDGHYA